MSTDTASQPTVPTVDILASVAARTADVVDAVGAGDLSRPTPCSDYDVQALLDHLIGWTRVFASCAAGDGPREGDGDDYRAPTDGTAGREYRSASQDLVRALRELGSDGQMTLMSTPMPASVVLGMSVGEQLAHGWDLATALGRDPGFTDSEAAAAMAGLAAMLTDEYRGEGKNFGHQVEVGDHASELERFIAFTGRDPRGRGGPRQADLDRRG